MKYGKKRAAPGSRARCFDCGGPDGHTNGGGFIRVESGEQHVCAKCLKDYCRDPEAHGAGYAAKKPCGCEH